MTKSQKIRERRLEEMEREFQALLLSCLQECAQGRWGLFGQNEHLDPDGRFWGWPEAARLKDLARQINSIRLEFGQPNDICEQFLHLCALRGSNVSGEPSLAARFLAEIDRPDLRRSWQVSK
jgi:hypothetical protein